MCHMGRLWYEIDQDMQELQSLAKPYDCETSDSKFGKTAFCLSETHISNEDEDCSHLHEEHTGPRAEEEDLFEKNIVVDRSVYEERKVEVVLMIKMEQLVMTMIVAPGVTSVSVQSRIVVISLNTSKSYVVIL